MTTYTGANVCVLAGGVGAARFLRGLVAAMPAEAITAIGNVGDDLWLHGLRICPDLDTVTYTLAGAVNADTGWGLQGESWNAIEALERYGGETWFRLGDRDLATHMFRTGRLAAGDALHSITAAITKAWDVGFTLLPATNDPVSTEIVLPDGGIISFQEYFVARRHEVPISGVRFAGADAASPAPGVLDAIRTADAVVIAPSNPLVSIDPILAVPGIRDALERRRGETVAISPIVGGRAVKGPAARMLKELGHEPSAVGVARHYASIAATLVIDSIDAALAPGVADIGLEPLVVDTMMVDERVSKRLASAVIGHVLDRQ